MKKKNSKYFALIQTAIRPDAVISAIPMSVKLNRFRIREYKKKQSNRAINGRAENIAKHVIVPYYWSGSALFSTVGSVSPAGPSQPPLL